MKAKKKKKKPGRPHLSHPENVMEHVVDVYRLARSGMSKSKIADALGVTYTTFKIWMDRYPAVRDAIAKGSAPPGEETRTFQDYVYDRLPENLQEVWRAIQECEKAKSPIDQVEAMLAEHGRRGRQHLFLYALVNSNFNATEACRKVNINRTVFSKWVTTDPDFAELVEEIQWHKANFFEAALIALVRAGDAKAILHVNKTFNAKRGYANPAKVKEVNVNVSGEVGQKFAVVSVADLNLPLEQRKAILEQYRNQKALPAHKED